MLHSNAGRLLGSRQEPGYQVMVGSTMFAMIESRPDIAFAISIVSRFAKNTSNAHIEAVKMIIRCLGVSTRPEHVESCVARVTLM